MGKIKEEGGRGNQNGESGRGEAGEQSRAAG